MSKLRLLPASLHSTTSISGITFVSVEYSDLLSLELHYAQEQHKIGVLDQDMVDCAFFLVCELFVMVVRQKPPCNTGKSSLRGNSLNLRPDSGAVPLEPGSSHGDFTSDPSQTCERFPGFGP